MAALAGQKNENVEFPVASAKTEKLNKTIAPALP